ncbi:hypothetical protein [Okeania sp. SIO2B3]|uniref:hypothetical protein n=1 Tax=Okeania sp. SIO2B3 TaxID=2607784 RepID=UPI0013BED382|nr:hypothetical protein [Okeania sp. SIO2B3]NET46322.1 hypothetical protein [Okeania sp. SIO2B3]
MNKTTQISESKHRTWTDTSYSLAADDLLFTAKATHGEAITLNCPGHSRDGHGFAIHFKVEHLEAIHSLLSELQLLKAEQIRSIK